MSNALLGGKSLISASLAAAAATGSAITGFEAANALDLRLAKTWQAPSGGPHTLTITLNTAATIYGIALVCPAGKPISGTATVVVKNGAGVIQKTQTLPAYSFAGLADRRYWPIYGGASCKSIEISVASGSHVGYVYAGVMADLWTALDAAWELELDSLAAVGAAGGRDVLYRASDRTAPIRARRFSGSLPTLEYSSSVALWNRFRECGAREPVMWLPRAVDPTTASTGEITMMQRTGLFGRFDRSLRMDWITGNGGSPIWRSRLVVTEAL